MVVNHLEKLFVTNDAATIIKELEVFTTICDIRGFMTSQDLLYIYILLLDVERSLFQLSILYVLLFT